MRASLGAGFVAGVAAGTVNNPFDVVKSRQQVAAAAGLRGHTLGAAAAAQRVARVSPGLLADMAELVRAEGVSALFRGWGAKVARLGPGSAIIFATHGLMVEALARRHAT